MGDAHYLDIDTARKSVHERSEGYSIGDFEDTMTDGVTDSHGHHNFVKIENGRVTFGDQNGKRGFDLRNKVFIGRSGRPTHDKCTQQ
jgi:hypothetical protein